MNHHNTPMSASTSLDQDFDAKNVDKVIYYT